KKRRLYNFGITAAYLGETIFHPGFITSVEYIPLQNNYSKMLLIGNLGFIVHPYNYSALFFNSEIGYRFTTPLGFMFDLSIGVGYMHLWLYMAQNSSIYERDSSGNVTTAINYGYPGLSPSFSMGIGWDLSKISKAPILIFTRIYTLGRFPVNNMMFFHCSLTIGVAYFFKLGNKK
nr:hypothetical protein [Spirochaetota bacterium]